MHDQDDAQQLQTRPPRPEHVLGMCLASAQHVLSMCSAYAQHVLSMQLAG